MFLIFWLINFFHTLTLHRRYWFHIEFLLMYENLSCMTCVNKRFCVRENEICEHCADLRHEQKKCIAINLLIVNIMTIVNTNSIRRKVQNVDENKISIVDNVIEHVITQNYFVKENIRQLNDIDFFDHKYIFCHFCQTIDYH